MGSFDNALRLALGAGKLFNVEETSEYIDTIIAKCIDHYTKLQVDNFELSAEGKPLNVIDRRLEDIVNRMFQRFFEDKKFKQAIGIAIETRRLDIFERAIQLSTNIQDTISYAYKIALQLIQNRKFRNAILQLLVKLYSQLPNPDHINMIQCLIFLDKPDQVASILETLIKTNKNPLMAYQLAFDLYESATQQFLNKVKNLIKALIINIPSQETMETDSTTSEVVKQEPQEVELKNEFKEQIDKLLLILSGEITINVNMQFLIKNNHSDLLVLKTIKDAVRNSICHTATVICNSLMHCGTTSDQFLRDNLDWLARATNWAKFTATASLGVIHKGHEKEALNLMSTYLPKDSNSSNNNNNNSPYSDGGALYALGLIHANHGSNIIDYLHDQLKKATQEPVRHGACLGLGLAAMGTARQDIYEDLKNNLYQDDAIIGEAAGISIGLVMLGTRSQQALQDMLQYAQDTQHEKILRGLAIGIALTVYGQLEESKILVDTLIQDKDPILRRCGMYSIAMAYCGTGNNEAIRKLLHVAVSDVNDDVRRAAVEALGFIMFRTPEQCPSMVSLLSESYNPHVRYGAAMALGIACAGTGNKEALNVLEPMLNDAVNYVRQGVLIAMSLVCIQHTEHTCPKVKTLRETLIKIISDKHDDVIAKYGAIIAHGILDAGGRNMSISLQTRSGQTDMAAAVGLLVFTQFWYWFPLSHFLSLALQPTSLIALNKDLKMPKIEFVSQAAPSVFGYPAAMEIKKDEKKEKIEKAVLSITVKQKKRDAEKKATTEGDAKMDIDEATSAQKEQQPSKEEATQVEEEKSKKSIKEKEPDHELIHNPCRAMKPQLKVIQMQKSSRYQVVKDLSYGGIILVKDTQSDQPENLVETIKAHGVPVKQSQEDEKNEPEPPEPFEWTDE